MLRNSTPFVPQRIHGPAGCRWSRRARCCAPGPLVELEVLVDLALALADGRLVERELHPVVAVGHDLGHQRRVVGGDVLADELGHVHEAHDPVVEAPPTRPSGRARRCRRCGRGPGTAASAGPRDATRSTPPPRSPAGRGRRNGGRRRRAGRGCAGCRRRWRWRRCGWSRARRYSSCGSSSTVAPARRAWAMHRSTSGTSSAMSTTPSPCLRWWSACRLSGSTAPQMTNRIEPDSRTYDLWSRCPVSGPR